MYLETFVKFITAANITGIILGMSLENDDVTLWRRLPFSEPIPIMIPALSQQIDVDIERDKARCCCTDFCYIRKTFMVAIYWVDCSLQMFFVAEKDNWNV